MGGKSNWSLPSNRTCTVAITAQIHLGDDAGQLISAG
jgi:hypothetical protein